MASVEGATPVPSVNPTEPQPQSNGVEPRYFVVGCVLLVAALGFAIWGFSQKDLTESQREILRWLLPLCSGFCAGAFVGSLTVTTRGIIPGMIATAAGGFGVWLLSVFVLFPAHPTVIDPSFPPLPSLSDRPESKGLSLLTDTDRQKQEYKKTLIKFYNGTRHRIRVGLKYIASQAVIPEASADNEAGIITEPIEAGNYIDLPKERFGGPAFIWVASAPEYAWRAIGWRDLKVVASRELKISEALGEFDCDLQ